MSLPLIAEKGTAEPTWRKRVSESINGILRFAFDNSRVRSATEIADGVRPVDPSYPLGDSRRYNISANSEDVLGWFDYGTGATRVDDDEFTVPGDQTARFTLHRRVKVYGTSSVSYGIVRESTFGSGVTTVELGLDTGVLPNPIASVAVQISSSAYAASSTVVNANSELYAYLIGNLSSGSSALGRLIIGCGQESNGAFEAAIAIVAVPEANAAIGTGPWDVSSGPHCVIHTGAAIPIGIATGDVLRLYLDGAGAPTVLTTDLSINKSALINNNAELIINGATDAKIELQSGQTERGYLYASSSEMITGSVTNIDYSIIQNNTRVVSFNGPNNTGTATPTLSANKPGANAGVIAWISVKTGAGTQGWIPIFGN